MTPKSLLRHKLSVSTMADLSEGRFQPVIDEVDAIDAAKVRRVVFCSGKVYYDLLERRRAEKDSRLRWFASKSCILPGGRLPGRTRSLRQCTRDRLVPGGTAEPGLPGTRSATACRRRSTTARAALCGSRWRAAPATGLHAIHQREQGSARRGRIEPDTVMTTEVRVPQLPESVADATLVAWHKRSRRDGRARRELARISRPTRSCSRCPRRSQA